MSERILGHYFLSHLDQVTYGPGQYAYRPKRRARDAVLFYILSWISLLNRGIRIGIYNSDVSGAFDRVSSNKLTMKLRAWGLHENILAVLRSWLAKRKSSVVVAGAKTKETELCDQVFQGTTWGPPLWNVYIADLVLSTEALLFIIVLPAV